ncbi:MAG: UDP-galactopyranose mutase [Oscillospiraceae bacterium]|jgi:UDP-galactopyranose mutase|nr:UDP-galactopyranose mutase [Oscillospiraceae bacterium]
MAEKYDVLVVGAGLFGAVCANLLAARGALCLVIDRRPHIAGLAYTEETRGIAVHKYGAHIFHTSDAAVWEYVNRFAEFNNYINSPLAVYKDELYNLPFNMNTFHQMWGIKTPTEARRMIAKQTDKRRDTEPANLEEQAISLVGRDIYEKLIKGYTQKQWGKDCRDLPAYVIKRIPCRFTYNNNYFNDRWQGIPIDGYTNMIARMLDGVEVRLNTNYAALIEQEPRIAERVIYTGCIDEFFGFRLGALEYRSLRFETEELEINDYQGVAVVNYTDADVPYTRIIEHKHFTFGEQPHTIITREYPAPWHPDIEPFYPVNNPRTESLYNAYTELANRRSHIIFGGRLGKYRYFDMDKTVKEALNVFRDEL